MSVRFENPILYGDYSDPDVIRVGEDFYMISSSFTYVPGIPVLHSRDLVHWHLIGYAAERLPHSRYDRPVHRCGLFAPSLRWHNGLFYVYVCMPDEGLYAFTAEDPAGKWTCHLVKDVTGWIDPCPLFDEDGRVYLVHGFAGSRVGINNLLYIHRMSPDGLQVLDLGKRVYDGAEHDDDTVEGPKLYRRNGYYWILCPAGGVTGGYQLALRSRSIFGPYERRVVLSQGNTQVNGPHQGGLVSDGRGGDWFIHFQDVGVYGRIPHLQPVSWQNDWPVMGLNGEPAPGGTVPLESTPCRVADSDDFAFGPGLQWQWQCNPCPEWYSPLQPGLRLFACPAPTPFEAGQFLSQMMQRRDFDMEVSITPHLLPGGRAGIGVMGYVCHALAAEEGRILLIRDTARDRGHHCFPEVKEEILCAAAYTGETVRMILRVAEGKGRFLFAVQGEKPSPFGEPFALSQGGWTGARPGLFSLSLNEKAAGYADFHYVCFSASIAAP